LLRFLPFALAALLISCASVPGPRFGQDVATSFARSPMRKLTTKDLEVYYPAPAAEAAHAVAARMGECLVILRAKSKTQRPRDRALVYLTDANFNNAYLSGQSDGEPLHTIDPLYATTEAFHLDNLGTAAIADIGCHELLHYVHYEQVEGFWRLVNAVFGDVMPPQAFLERWFTEGLAQYYEGRLGRQVGRPFSPLYRAELASGLAARGGWVGAGDLNLGQRELVPSSGAYLTGLHFIEYLAKTHGEEKLWELIDMQGHSIFSPFGVALRFKAVYGLSLGALIDAFSEENQALPRTRLRPADQIMLRDAVGYVARLATANDGSMALLTAGRDEVPLLRILEKDGTTRAERSLTLFLPVRDWVSAHPSQMSGLSFTADSKWLYLMNDDVTIIGDARAQLWKVDAQTGDVVTVWPDVGGLGGAVHPSGDRYLFVDLSPNRSELAEFDLRTGEKRVLTTHGEGVTYAAPAWDPKGQRIAYSRFSTRGWDLFLREADGKSHALTADGQFNYGARWVDDQHLVFMRTEDGRAQGHQLDLQTGLLSVVTDAPFAAFDVAPLPGGQLAFLDREGWNWSLASAPLKVRQMVALTTVSTAVPAPPPSPIAVVADQPYQPLEGFFVPLLRMPSLVNLFNDCDRNNNCHIAHSYALLLAGKDRLSFHNWAIAATLALPDADFSVAGYYTNQTQAPWSASTSLGFSAYATHEEGEPDGRIEDLSGDLTLSRSFWSTPFGLSLGGFRQWDSSRGVSHFFGPSVGFDYFAGESTVYGGLRRGLGVSANVALYPQVLSSYTVVDVSGTVTLGIPLPFLKRHSLIVTIDGRAVEGAPEGALQVGGLARGTDLLRFNASQGEPGPGVPLPRSFSIPVRGYEDYSVRANRAAVAIARYRYPFVIDRGFASIFYLFPSLFFRQVDLDAFAAAALTDSATHPWLRSVGAGVSARFTLGGALPISIYARWAWRMDERLRPLYSVGFAFE